MRRRTCCGRHCSSATTAASQFPSGPTSRWPLNAPWGSEHLRDLGFGAVPGRSEQGRRGRDERCHRERRRASLLRYHAGRRAAGAYEPLGRPPSTVTAHPRPTVAARQGFSILAVHRDRPENSWQLETCKSRKQARTHGFTGREPPGTLNSALASHSLVLEEVRFSRMQAGSPRIEFA